MEAAWLWAVKVVGQGAQGVLELLIKRETLVHVSRRRWVMPLDPQLYPVAHLLPTITVYIVHHYIRPIVVLIIIVTTDQQPPMIRGTTAHQVSPLISIRCCSIK